MTDMDYWFHKVKTQLAKTPNDFSLHIELANLYQQSGDLYRAIQIYDQIISKDSQYLPAEVNKARLLFSQHKLQQALLIFQQIIQIAPECYQGYYGKAVISHFFGNLQESMINYDMALEYNTTHVPSLFNKAVILQSWGLYPQALEICKNVVSLNSSHMQAHTMLAVLTCLTGNREGLDYFPRALELAKDQQFPLYWQAVCFNTLNLQEAAMKCIDKALAAFTEFPAAILLKAQLLIKEDKALTALQFAKQNIHICGQYAPMRIFLAKIYCRLSRYDQSIDQYKIAFELDPLNHEVCRDLGIVYMDELHDYNKALNYLYIALNLRGEDHECLQRIQQCKAQMRFSTQPKTIQEENDIEETILLMKQAQRASVLVESQLFVEEFEIMKQQNCEAVSLALKSTMHTQKLAIVPKMEKSMPFNGHYSRTDPSAAIFTKNQRSENMDTAMQNIKPIHCSQYQNPAVERQLRSNTLQLQMSDLSGSRQSNSRRSSHKHKTQPAQLLINELETLVKWLIQCNKKRPLLNYAGASAVLRDCIIKISEQQQLSSLFKKAQWFLKQNLHNMSWPKSEIKQTVQKHFFNKRNVFSNKLQMNIYNPKYSVYRQSSEKTDKNRKETRNVNARNSNQGQNRLRKSLIQLYNLNYSASLSNYLRSCPDRNGSADSSFASKGVDLFVLDFLIDLVGYPSPSESYGGFPTLSSFIDRLFTKIPVVLRNQNRSMAVVVNENEVLSVIKGEAPDYFWIQIPTVKKGYYIFYNANFNRYLGAVRNSQQTINFQLRRHPNEQGAQWFLDDTNCKPGHSKTRLQLQEEQVGCCFWMSQKIIVNNAKQPNSQGRIIVVPYPDR